MTSMDFINWTLRLSSIAILILIFVQFAKSKWTKSHITRGKWVMALGIIIFICIVIRGWNNEHITRAYIMHLLSGAPFFIFLFMTGRYGYLTKYVNEKYMKAHRLSAYATLVSLVVTLVLGIISMFSH